jgi:prepilin-type N-terminal cleavage/methylation domain-containing protein
MRQAASGVRLRAREESGFTLIELLVAILLFVLVIGAALSSLNFAQSQAPKNIEYSHAISDATSGLQKMMREIRNAYKVNGTNGDPSTGVGSVFDFYAYLRIGGTDQDWHIEYECDVPSPTNATYDACVRVAEPAGTALPSNNPCTPVNQCSVVIDRVPKPGNLFTFLGADGTADSIYPTYIRAAIQVPAAGSYYHGLTHNITLNNGTALPNLQNGA